MADLSSLLSSSKALNSQFVRPDLPSVHLSLDQIEAQSRRLAAARTHQPSADQLFGAADSTNGTAAAYSNERANYLLAQAQVDAPNLTESVSNLNATNIFAPRQAVPQGSVFIPALQVSSSPLLTLDISPTQNVQNAADALYLRHADVANYLRYSHEQNLITTIEEARKETQDEFYRLLEEKGQREWEAKKKRVFEELGGRRITSGQNDTAELHLDSSGRRSVPLTLTCVSQWLICSQSQRKMLAYSRVVTSFNTARLQGVSFPIINQLMNSTWGLQSNDDAAVIQTWNNLHVLSRITGEPRELATVEAIGHDMPAQVHNLPIFQNKFARVYLGDLESREAIDLRKQIAAGAREALEQQYWNVLMRTVTAHPQQAQVGGDPSAANQARSFTWVMYYRNGAWADRIELIGGHPVWAIAYFLVRTGHTREALQYVEERRAALESRVPSFATFFREWINNTERQLPPTHRTQIQSIYNQQMMLSNVSDRFKIALLKLMGKLEPHRRSVQDVTVTTEDWLWFQLSMVEEESEGGLRGLAEVLLGYGERQFEGEAENEGGVRGVWAGVLLMCGQFERAVAALWDHQETEVDAVHLAIALAYHGLLRVASRAETGDMSILSLSSASPPAINLSMLIWRYIRQFVKMDAKEALQYVYCVCLVADQGRVGKEQLENAWDLVRRIIVLSNSGAAWEELVGGFRSDGSRFNGIIEQGASLLQLEDTQQFNTQILLRAAKHSQENDRISEAIKLYNLAEDYKTVVACLAAALGNTVAQPTPDEKSKALEHTAAEILRHYERTNRAAGKDRDAVIRLLRIRQAMNLKNDSKFESALEMIESTDLIPLDGDVAKITRRAEEFKDLHEALQRNLQTYLPLTMDILMSLHQKIKKSILPEATKQTTLNDIRRKSRSLIIFAGMLKYRMSPDVYSYLARVDVEIAL
ncbi:nucleoporin-interacting protein NIC96 [Fistulina hepatica ATCC 64428]|uniref:Nuclear pore protein n=1 Tax=Fistulina hepatica ATCC 64428 TaxID=1128425 RepID=A0A0D7AIS5_9AGAR|nr:nucleoporin-interacting protein NIC96 [Fistulina hepatica ATCC 64428]